MHDWLLGRRSLAHVRLVISYLIGDVQHMSDESSAAKTLAEQQTHHYRIQRPWKDRCACRWKPTWSQKRNLVGGFWPLLPSCCVA